MVRPRSDYGEKYPPTCAASFARAEDEEWPVPLDGRRAARYIRHPQPVSPRTLEAIQRDHEDWCRRVRAHERREGRTARAAGLGINSEDLEVGANTPRADEGGGIKPPSIPGTPRVMSMSEHDSDRDDARMNELTPEDDQYPSSAEEGSGTQNIFCNYWIDPINTIIIGLIY
jgi:hypothetical protein